MAVTVHGLTLEEFLRLPEKKPALEYIDGEVVRKVSPKGRHSRIQGGLSGWINQRTQPQRVALAFPELRTTYAGRSTVPDVVVYLWERIPWTADGEVPDEFLLPPDVAIEILSPRQHLTPLVRKCHWYVAHRVRLALLIDPDDRTVLVFRPSNWSAALRGADVIDFGDVLPGLQLTVDALFSMLKG